MIRRPLPAPVRLVKGSHIVVRRRFEHDCGYLLQAADGRVVFALPFAQEFTLIGTTDENFVGDVNSPAPDSDEVAARLAPAHDLAVDEFLESPHVLVGTLSQLTDKVERLREELGFSSFTLSRPALDELAPLVDALTST